MSTLHSVRDQALSKMPPHSIEAEQGLLSCILLKNDKIFTAMSFLEPDEFFSRGHRSIYQAMCVLAKAKEIIDVLTVGEELRKNGTYLEAGGIDYLTEIEDYVPTSEVTGHFIGLIKRCAYFRGMAAFFSSGYDQAFSMSEDVDSVISDWNAAFSKLNHRYHSRSKDDGVISSLKIAKLTMERVQETLERKVIPGIKTGFHNLDAAIGGLKPLTIISAGTGVGKTALALNFAEDIGVRNKIPTLYLNYEMDKIDLSIRIQALSSGIPMHQISGGTLLSGSYSKLSKNSDYLSQGNLFVSGNEPKNIDHTIDLIHKYYQEHEIQVVFIDYLGEMEPDRASRGETNYESFGRWLQMLKNECGTLGIRLVVLAQLNRSGNDEAPGMNKVGGSWQIAQKADVFLVLGTTKSGGHYIKINKNRNGPNNITIPVMFHKETQRIEEE